MSDELRHHLRGMGDDIEVPADARSGAARAVGHRPPLVGRGSVVVAVCRHRRDRTLSGEDEDPAEVRTDETTTKPKGAVHELHDPDG